MSQRADADHVHAGRGQRGDALQADSAGYFDDGAPVRALHSDGDLVVGEIVEHDHVGASVQRFIEHLQRFDLDLDAAGVRGVFLGTLDGRTDAARGDDVIVFDQHRRALVVAVIVSATAAYRVAFQEAQPGRGLARVDDAREWILR